jgi:NADPH:quinone reductase-like Zn-dependent oxidoreductase
MECVGTVDAVGEGVETVAVGQRVITVGITGTWQQHVAVDAARVVAVPDGTARTACTRRSTAWRADSAATWRGRSPPRER